MDGDTAAGLPTVCVKVLEADEGEGVFILPKTPPLAPVASMAEIAVSSLVQDRNIEIKRR